MNIKAKSVIAAVIMAVFLTSVPLYPLQAADFDNPGLLPSNPFYFVKKWTRGLRRALTFKDINKTELELTILDEKAGEISKLLKILPDDDSALQAALANYNQSLQSIRTFDDLTEKQLNQLLINLIKHHNLFSKNQANLIKLLIEKYNYSSAFRELMANAVAIENNHLFLIKLASLINELESQISVDHQYHLHRLKEEILIKFALINNAPVLIGGDIVDQLLSLDFIRSLVSESALKTKLNLLRQNTLDFAESKKIIDSRLAGALLQEAKGLFNRLAEKTQSEAILFQPKFHLAQTESFINEAQFGAALGQASLALVSTMNELFNLLPLESAPSYQEEINLLKKQYDLLPEHSLKPLAEKLIIDLADFVKKTKIKFPDQKTEKSLIEIRLLLAKIKFGG